jgi:hypothetical protein
MAACRDGWGIDPNRLYVWRGDVSRITGLGRPTLDRLESSPLLEIRCLGRRAYVRGDQLIAAIWDAAERKQQRATDGRRLD